MTDRVRKLVVAGLIGDGAGHVLITQRLESQSMPLRWEFPGGKVEPGESPAAALARELEEELGVRVVVGRIWEVLYHPYPEFDLVMLVYSCRLEPGQEPGCVEVRAMAWTDSGDLSNYDFLPADRGLLDRLRDEGFPPIFEKPPVD